MTNLYKIYVIRNRLSHATGSPSEAMIKILKELELDETATSEDIISKSDKLIPLVEMAYETIEKMLEILGLKEIYNKAKGNYIEKINKLKGSFNIE